VSPSCFIRHLIVLGNDPFPFHLIVDV
jgi:hypothetical protein